MLVMIMKPLVLLTVMMMMMIILTMMMMMTMTMVMTPIAGRIQSARMSISKEVPVTIRFTPTGEKIPEHCHHKKPMI